MQFEVEVGGRAHQVAVTRAGEKFLVTVDGRTLTVDPVQIDDQTLSLIVECPPGTGAESVVGAGRRDSYEVAISPDAATGQTAVRVGPLRLVATVNGRRRWGAKQAAASADGPQRLMAPMPGKIVRVLVEPGEAVQARQPLVVVEAMKMENELRAARDGSVAEVHVKEGASVDAGELLVVVQ